MIESIARNKRHQEHENSGATCHSVLSGGPNFAANGGPEQQLEAPDFSSKLTQHGSHWFFLIMPGMRAASTLILRDALT